MTVTRTPRPGVATVEFAVVSSAALLFVIGLIVGALGVFRYQEVARLAREGARYASVRGDSYANATGRPAATPDDVHQQAILPNAVILDPSKLTSAVTWDPDKRVGATVTVRVSYVWIPETIFPPVTMSCSAAQQVSY